MNYFNTNSCFYSDDLLSLEDILDKIGIDFFKNTTNDCESIDTDVEEEENENSFTTYELEELTISILHLFEDFNDIMPKILSEPDYEENLFNYAKNIITIPLLNFDEDTLDDLIEETMEIFYTTMIPRRSWPTTFIMEDKINIEEIEKKILCLQLKPQPQQKTPEWYEFRHNLITASNAYKAFESDSNRNQLIFEKCCPIDTTKFSFVNVNSPLHWGQKYEPVSVMFYEHHYKTKIADFGCIQHPKYPFIGASPDGININKTTGRYGRMLEIKNIVNREINGIPKKEYWIQTQLQMEVCDLDTCDFLETHFIEYENFTEFNDDGKFTKSVLNEYKGVIMYFSKAGNPFYVYMPFTINTIDAMEKWESEMRAKYVEYTWFKNIFWKLESFSCVLIERNFYWFEKNIECLEKLWDIVLKERETCFSHRAPQKRTFKKLDAENIGIQGKSVKGCLLKINKESGKIELI